MIFKKMDYITIDLAQRFLFQTVNHGDNSCIWQTYEDKNRYLVIR